MVTQYKPLVINRQLARSLHAVQRKIAADPRKELGEMLQAALQLEFAVIPVYLSAAFSLDNRNEAIRNLITRVAIEEMLHFTIVANTMNAIGIPPDIAAAIPSYPCRIAVVEPALHLELKPFSDDLVKELFLRIETPEEPIEYKVKPLAPPPPTVGDFYRAIIKIIESQTIPGLFDVDPASRNVAIIPGPPAFPSVAYRDDNDQYNYPIPTTIDFRITDCASAVRHLKWIVDQGEGTTRDDTDPIDVSGLPAHYYRFVSILKRKYLIADAAEEKKYSYSGGSLPFDEEGRHDFDANPKVEDYAAHEDVAYEMNRFNAAYSKMIDALKAAFASRDGDAATIAYRASIRKMQGLLGLAGDINAAAVTAGVRAGVPFQYQPT